MDKTKPITLTRSERAAIQIALLAKIGEVKLTIARYRLAAVEVPEGADEYLAVLQAVVKKLA